MAYDADPSATHNPATGGTPSAAWGDILNANFAEIGAAWTSYTPTWTASGTAPALGNGTLAGGYKKLGKLLFVRIRWLAGSTTTFGTGQYFWALPSGVTAAASVEQILAGKGFDTSATTHYAINGYVSGGGSTVGAFIDVGGTVGQTTPVTWANGDHIHFTGCIEVA